MHLVLKSSENACADFPSLGLVCGAYVVIMDFLILTFLWIYAAEKVISWCVIRCVA